MHGQRSLGDCFVQSPLLLTEGAIGQRIEREFHMKPDPAVNYACLLYAKESRNALKTLYLQYITIAQELSLPILLMTNTRRANQERVMRSAFAHQNMMKDYTDFLFELKAQSQAEVYIGGMMGCKGDAYSGKEGLPTEEAVTFHAWQASQFEASKLDFMFAGIMPALPEAIGMARVMQTLQKPTIISLMIGKEGRLLDGTTLHDAICAIDAKTEQKPLCYMSNCVHPDVLREALSQPFNQTRQVRNRYCGLQANAANMRPDQLDGSETLQSTSAKVLADAFVQLHSAFPMKIYGGCCGTDDTHIREMAIRMKREVSI